MAVGLGRLLIYTLAVIGGFIIEISLSNESSILILRNSFARVLIYLG